MDNRSKILQVALELFTSKGYDGVGVQEIVDTAGITKPTLYHYFKSKEGLLKALLEEYFGRFLKRFQEAADYQRDLTLTLTNILKVSLEFYQGNPLFFRFQLALLAAAPESSAYKMTFQYFEALHEILEAVFKAATNEHGNMRGRHQLYAAIYFGFVNTYTGQVMTKKLAKSDQLIYQALHQFMYGIFS